MKRPFQTPPDFNVRQSRRRILSAAGQTEEPADFSVNFRSRVTGQLFKVRIDVFNRSAKIRNHNAVARALDRPRQQQDLLFVSLRFVEQGALETRAAPHRAPQQNQSHRRGGNDETNRFNELKDKLGIPKGTPYQTLDQRSSRPHTRASQPAVDKNRCLMICGEFQPTGTHYTFLTTTG